MWPGFQGEEKHRNPSLSLLLLRNLTRMRIESSMLEVTRTILKQNSFENFSFQTKEMTVCRAAMPGIQGFPRLETPTTYEYLTGMTLLSSTGRFFDTMVLV